MLTTEKLALAAAGLCVALSWLLGLTIHLPDLSSARFIATHYLEEMLPGFALVLALPALNKKAVPEWPRVFRLVLAFAVVLLVHFNFKLWSSLINPYRFDAMYQFMDKPFQELIAFCDAVYARTTFFYRLSANPYHDLFVSLFLLAFMAAAFRPGVFEKLVFACALVLLLGGLSYALAPAWGPFLFEPSAYPEAQASQSAMLSFYAAYVQTRGGHFDGRYFVAPLAAMPSLHMAHTVALAWMSIRHAAWLALIFVPLTIWMACAAVALRWHYLADVLAGVLLGLGAVWITNRIYSRREDIGGK